VISRSDVSKRNNFKPPKGNITSQTVLPSSQIIIRRKVYEIGAYLRAATDNTTFTARADISLFPIEYTNLFLQAQGKDISDQYNALPNADVYLACMDDLFFVGYTPDNAVCFLFPVTYALAGVVLLPMLLHFLLALGHLAAALFEQVQPKPTSLVAFLVHCKDESREELIRSVDSIAASNYDANRKVMIFMFDGETMVDERRQMLPNYRLLLSLLRHSDGESNAQSYTSLAGSIDSLANNAKVYSGVYVGATNDAIPYLVVAKLGGQFEAKETSGAPPGQRGTRDSLRLFLNMMLAANNRDVAMSAVEYEVYVHLAEYLKIDPRQVEYCLTMDGRTQLQARAVSRLVSRLDTQGELSMAVARLEPRHYFDSFSTAMLAWPFFYRWDISLRLEHMTAGSITVPPTKSCVLYRLKHQIFGEPALLDPTIITQFSQGMNVPTTMHQHNQTRVADERFMTAVIKSDRLVQSLSVDYVRDAIAYRSMSDTDMFSLGMEDFNGTFHLFWALTRHASSVWLQVYAFFRAFYMLLTPAVIVCWYYFLGQGLAQFMPRMSSIKSSKDFLQNANGYLMLALFSSIIVLGQLVLMLLRLRLFQFISSLAYFIIGMPLYDVLVPLMAIWNWDTIVPAVVNGNTNTAFVASRTLNEWKSMEAGKQEDDQYSPAPPPPISPDLLAAQQPRQEMNRWDDIEYGEEEVQPLGPVSIMGPSPYDEFNDRVSLDEDPVIEAPPVAAITPVKPAAAAQQYFKPTNFDEDRPAARPRDSVGSVGGWRKSEIGRKSIVPPVGPDRAVSMARSDYSSVYSPSIQGNRVSMRSLANRHCHPEHVFGFNGTG